MFGLLPASQLLLSQDMDGETLSEPYHVTSLDIDESPEVNDDVRRHDVEDAEKRSFWAWATVISAYVHDRE